MSLRVTCPHCETELTISDDLAAEGRILCPECDHTFAMARSARTPTRRASRVARATESEIEDQSKPTQRGGTYSTIGCLLLLVFMCAGGCGVCNRMKNQALEEIALGDSLYAEGKKAEAVAKYKSGYSYATDAQKPGIIKRVADFEASSGNSAEARRWVEKGLSGGIEIAYDSQPARDILSQIQRERAEAEAKKKEAEDRKKADRAEKEKEHKEEAANRKRYGDSSDATTAAHTFVKRQLLFPEEAKFGIFGRTSKQNPDNSWTVSGDVASKNAFGVKVKFQFFTTVMRAENGDWREVGATIVTE